MEFIGNESTDGLQIVGNGFLNFIYFLGENCICGSRSVNLEKYIDVHSTSWVEIEMNINDKQHHNFCSYLVQLLYIVYRMLCQKEIFIEILEIDFFGVYLGVWDSGIF